MLPRRVAVTRQSPALRTFQLPPPRSREPVPHPGPLPQATRESELVYLALTRRSVTEQAVHRFRSLPGPLDIRLVAGEKDNSICRYTRLRLLNGWSIIVK